MPYYIEDLIELNAESKLFLGKNLIIRKATEEEQYIIKKLVLKYGSDPIGGSVYFKYHEFAVKKVLESGGVQLKARTKNDFRYFVLDEIESDYKYKQTYAKAFLLMDKEFFIPFGFAKLTGETSGITIKASFDSELISYSYFNDKNLVFGERQMDLPKSFSSQDKVQFEKNLDLLNNFNQIDSHFPNVIKSLDDFFKIGEISNYSVFKIVSYFACLELLLVDNNYDRPKSIKLQLESKLNLLNNRIDQPVVVSKYIKVPDTITLGKIISIIYTYRSSIAHGESVVFEKKLEVLNKTSNLKIIFFLRTVLKRILIYALKEPQMIIDLKKC